MAIKDFFLKNPVIRKAASSLGFVPESTGYGNYTWGTEKDIMTGLKDANIDTLYEVIRKCPEVVGVISVIVEDLVSYGYVFDGAKSRSEAAQRFADKVNFNKILSNALWDALITGDGYILKLAVPYNEYKSIVDSHKTDLISKGFSETDAISKINEFMPSQTQGLQVLKSSTIKGKFDEYGNVIEWIQNVGGKELKFKAADVIHITFTNIGGSVYGFSPLQPLLADIATLIFAKDYTGKVFENEGMPPRLFILPEAIGGADDRNYQLVKNSLTEAKLQANKMRNMVLTGKVEVQEAQSWAKDMQFPELVKHLTSIILLAYGVPTYRVPFMYNKEAKQPSGDVETGYNNKLNYMQTLLEGDLNKQLWGPEFKVTMDFNRQYIINELREANIIAILADRSMISVEEARERLGLPPELVGTLPQNLKGGIGTAFNEDKDKRIADGKDGDLQREDPNTSQMNDNNSGGK